MQLTTLNKVVNLFLVGGFVVFLGIAWAEPSARELGGQRSSSAVVFLTLGLLSSAALAGMVIEALSETFVRWLLGPVAAEYRIFKWLKDYKGYRYWMKTFEAALLQAPPHKKLLCDSSELRAYAVAILFRSANPEHIQWAVQHYSMFMLATNFAVVALLSGAFVWIPAWSLDLATRIWVTIGSAAIVPLLSIFAQDKWYYSYEIAFRNGALALLEECDSAGQ